MLMQARIERRRFTGHGRIFAISDVHGNLPYLKGLLEKISPTAEDTVVFCGDTMEKGPSSLDTLHFLMDLKERVNCWFVLGNCDYWYDEHNHSMPCRDWYVKDYLLTNANGNGPGLLQQMCDAAGIVVDKDFDIENYYRTLGAMFPREFEFLASMPQVIETDSYIFVHGGLPKGDPGHWDGWDCMKNDDFMGQGRKFDKWVIVGHWPVQLYGGDVCCANPIIDRDSHIISIDGGCVLKDDGQLNALVIPHDGSDDFGLIAYDPFPVRRVKSAQAGGGPSTYIRWGDNQVEILSRGEEFSRVRHVRTGYELDILTKYLYGESGVVRCNDCTDYVLPLEAGDEVSVIETTSRGYLVKHEGVSGWYYGELE